MTVKYDEPLGNYTTFKIGGRVRAMYFPEDCRSAVQLLDDLHKQGIAPYIMGNGSNILAGDSDMDIVVINTAKLNKIELTDTVITAESGVLLSELAVFAENHSLTGLEFAHGIPGTLGGAVVMNAGAYGGEMKNVVVKTRAYSVQKGKYIVTGGEHGFSYRNSVFSQGCSLILSSDIRLKKGDRDAISRKMDEYASRRRGNQPLDMPSAGSFFKRPKEGYAAQLIEQAGLKGFAVGGAQISPKHAGFIVNTGNASFDDVIALAEHVHAVVREKTGIELETEAKVWKI